MNPSAYINWILYAIYGLMAEADAVACDHAGAITKIAATLRRRHPIPTRTLYRGVLLDGADTLRTEPNLSFLSWSEDPDVARWFGSPDSYISQPFRERYPQVRGFALRLARPTTPVLWHHSWRNAFGMPLERLALAHPLLGYEACRQIAWSLDTQAEVITAPMPIDELPHPEPVENLPGAALPELDRRLSPPWVAA
jgi:hypothetical protein